MAGAVAVAEKPNVEKQQFQFLWFTMKETGEPNVLNGSVSLLDGRGVRKMTMDLNPKAMNGYMVDILDGKIVREVDFKFIDKEGRLVAIVIDPKYVKHSEVPWEVNSKNLEDSRQAVESYLSRKNISEGIGNFFGGSIKPLFEPQL